MFNKILLVAVASISLFAVGCKDKAVSWQKSADGSFEYAQHMATGGEKIKKDDVVTFSFAFRKGKEFVGGSQEDGLPGQMLMPDAATAKLLHKPFFLMSKGDSLSIRVVSDSLKKYFPKDIADKYKYGEMMEIDFKVLKVQTIDEIKAEGAKQTEAAKAGFEELRKDSVNVVARAADVEKQLSQSITDYKAGKLDSKLVNVGKKGLKYLLHDAGNGRKADVNTVVFVHYCGMTVAEGKKFDASFPHGIPFAFPLGAGRVIQGWDRGISQLKEGAKATFFIPADLAYGDEAQGADIPANSELAFYIEVLKVY
jgi:FKBP-type peptidyl-prolyl cis-trans isomerase FkpA